MIIVRSERRLPPAKGISEYRRYPSLRMGSTVGSLAGNASAGCAWIRLSEPWDPTRRVFPLQIST